MAANLSLDNAFDSANPVLKESKKFCKTQRRFSSTNEVYDSNKETNNVRDSSGSHTGTKNFHKMERRYSDTATQYVRQRSITSSIMKRGANQMVPHFSINEMQLGGLLGTGAYCDVRKAWNLLEPSANAENKSEEKNEMGESSASLASPLGKEEKNQYAIKYIRREVRNNPELYAEAVKDLALEAEFLSNLHHPNIVKLRGVSVLGFDGFDVQRDGGYFFILEELSESMIDRLSKWKTIVKQNSKLKSKIMGSGSKALKQCFAERLNIALNLTVPLKYLHDHGIIYRDIKPQNIGFDAQGNLKLFDFGFAREINSEQNSANGTYKLTGNIGTQRYMAPEIALRKHYDQSVDVYSFSILLWELCSLETAFEGMSEVQHFVKTCHFHARPTINPTWPKRLKNLMKNSWSQNFHERPDFGAIESELKQLNAEISDGKIKKKQFF